MSYLVLEHITSHLFAICGSSFGGIDCRCGLAMDLLALHTDLNLVPLNPDLPELADAGGRSSHVPTLKRRLFRNKRRLF